MTPILATLVIFPAQATAVGFMPAMENAKAKGKAIGRPVTTTDNIPSIFYHYYPQYKNKKINKSELARLCSLSIPTVYKYLKIIEGQD